MQSPFYILPHECKSWQARKTSLIKILELDDLQQITNKMNKINDNNKWAPNIFGNIYSKQTIIKLIKFAVQCCLEVEKLFPNKLAISFPLVGQQDISQTVLTKRQALCLVANMFFGTTQHLRNNKNMPIYIDFTQLSRRFNEIVITILNYFQRCQQANKQKLNDENIVYFRLAQSPSFESWATCSDKLCEINFYNEGFIQDKQDNIQIDFANKSIGGFFLSETFTQQDIIFINNPELMPAVLIHKYMEPNECILMVGAQRYSKYTGYLQTYQFAGNFVDKRDIIKIKLGQNKYVSVKDSWISAIDAIPYFIKSQFSNENLKRQLTKSFVGFDIKNLDGGQKPISTGNWGSGAFNGNLEYKFLIQWLAASRAHRQMNYFSFQNPQAKRIPQIIKMFKNLTVGQLFNILVKNSEIFEETLQVFATLLKKQI